MFDRGRILAATAMAGSVVLLLDKRRDLNWAIVPSVVYVLGRPFVSPLVEAVALIITITLIAAADYHNPDTLLATLLFTCLYG